MKPEDFNFSYDWRFDAEKNLENGMSKEEIFKFVGYFMNCLPPNLYVDDIMTDREKYRNHLMLQIDKSHDLTDFF